MDWKFWVGDVVIPIITFIIGFFSGKQWSKHSKSNIKGNNNNVVQNSRIKK